MAELDSLTDVELVTLRQAVEDGGPAVWHGPWTRGSHDNVGRFLSEGGNLLPKYHWTLVWRCIVTLLEREPHLVTGPVPTQADLDARRAARLAQADALLADALGALNDGEWVAARALIDRAELELPVYPGRHSYADMRGFVRERRAAAATNG